MSVISEWVSFLSLLIAFVTLYRTRKSGEQQEKIEETRAELLRQSNIIQKVQVELAKSNFNLSKQVVAAQSQAVIEVSIVEEIGLYYLKFQNIGLGKAVNIYFEIIDHPKGHIFEPLNHKEGILIDSLLPDSEKRVQLKQQEIHRFKAQLNWSNPNGQEVKKRVLLSY